jgi:hypothetical protein
MLIGVADYWGVVVIQPTALIFDQPDEAVGHAARRRGHDCGALNATKTRSMHWCGVNDLGVILRSRGTVAMPKLWISVDQRQTLRCCGFSKPGLRGSGSANPRVKVRNLAQFGCPECAFQSSDNVTDCYSDRQAWLWRQNFGLEVEFCRLLEEELLVSTSCLFYIGRWFQSGLAFVTK